jgi:restriction system protein
MAAAGIAVFLTSPNYGFLQFCGLSAALLGGIAAVIAYVEPKRRDQPGQTLTGPESLRELSLDDIESLLAGAYGRLGYDIIDDPEYGGARGVDVRLYKDGRLALVQTKYWRDEITQAMVSALCDVVAAEKAAQGIIVTTGKVAPEARRFAQGKPLTLIDGPALWELVKDPSPA